MKKRILLVGFACVLFIGAFLLANRTHHITNTVATSTAQATNDPIDVTNSFFNAWLEGRQSTTSNPYDLGLADNVSLTDEVRVYIRANQATYTENDPVLCLPTVPSRIGSKPVFLATSTAQIMVIPRKLETPTSKSALVNLAIIENTWKITSISCSNGEEAPTSEFSFEKTGFATKNVPPPYLAGTWHIVFTQDDGRIGAIALQFDSTSRCTLADGAEATCVPDIIPEGSRINLKSNLTEDGTLVKYLMVVSL